MEKPFVSCKNLSVGYSDKVLIKDINVTIDKNANIGLIGENGSGKTTLLKTLLGIIKPVSGKVAIDKNNTISYIPQIRETEDLLPFSVEEILEMGLSRQLKPWQSALPRFKDKFDSILERVSLTEYRKHLFKNLSGGQKQRIMLAQALISSPDAIILDEPTQGLDVYQRKNFMKLLKEIKQEKEFALILVSHIFDDFKEMDFNIYRVEDECLKSIDQKDMR
ncbi:MAG: metal ABC transporter ATP-binding protein [Candidatus Riflebacteria bacterium]|nr:metal ABC transporter ATP-binding protein [Candidatus Riflebacteria bacterium]